MSFEILNQQYCCALYGGGRLDEADALLGIPEQPHWITNQGIFEYKEGKWSIAVGVAHEDEEWRQDDDVESFTKKCFEFLYWLSKTEDAGLHMHLHYSEEGGGAVFSPQTLGVLASLRIGLDIEFTKKSAGESSTKAAS